MQTPPRRNNERKREQNHGETDNKKFLLCDPASISSAMMMRLSLKKVLKKHGVKPAKMLASLCDDAKVVPPGVRRAVLHT